MNEFVMQNRFVKKAVPTFPATARTYKYKGKAVPLHAMEALGGRVSIAPTDSRPLH
jgi:hypothetical protein